MLSVKQNTLDCECIAVPLEVFIPILYEALSAYFHTLFVVSTVNNFTVASMLALELEFCLKI